MEQLIKALKDFWARMKDWANRIEESPIYERMIAKYDSLEPNQARRWTRVLVAIGGVLAVCLYFYPLWNVVGLKWELSSYRRALAEMESINANHKPQARKTYSPPVGWQNLPSENQDEFLTSVDQFLAQIGVIPELTKIETNGNETSIDFQELSIRQAVSFLFQLEGWYPGVKIVRQEVNAHPQSKELLTMKLRFRYEGAAGGMVGGQPSGMEVDSGDDDFSAPPLPEGQGNRAGMTPQSPMPQNPPESFGGEGGDEFDVPPPPPPPPVMDDFGQDMPPPLEEDL
jgi:hypothetical protein